MMKRDNLKLIFLVLGGISLALVCLFSGFGFWKQTEEITKVRPKEEKETATIVLSLNPSELTIYRDKEFTVNIFTQTEKKLVGVDLYLSYDPQILELQEISPGVFFTNAQELSKDINTTSGEVFYAVTGITPKAGKGMIASFAFRGKLSNKEALISLDKETQIAIQEEEKTVLKLPEAGKYTILEPTE